MLSWVRDRFEHLRRWREYALKVAKAARDVLGDVRNLLNYVVIVGVIAAVLIISIKLVLYVKSTLR